MDETGLEHLLNLYLDHALAASEKAELEDILLGSAEARRYFWRHTSLHAFTREAAQLKWCELAQEAAQPGAQPVFAIARRWKLLVSALSAWRWTLLRSLVASGVTAVV